jgi:hypothetical protein
MALFRKRHGRFAPANTPMEWLTTDVWLTEWEPPLNIVRGEQHRREAFDSMFGVDPDGVFSLATVELIREPTNRFDANAVRVECDGVHLGYLAKEIAAVWSGQIEAVGDPQIAFPGVVRGGAKNMHHGLHLWPHRRLTPAPPFDFDEAQYAVPWPPWELERILEDALDADDADTHEDDGDDFHDDALDAIEDPRAAPHKVIKQARRLLEERHDPLYRHFVYNALEAALYKCRDAFESALADHEQVCEQHHAEMATIRPALLEFFEDLPRIPMYKQMAISKKKQRDYETARMWAQRGLDIYGSDAARQDVVSDLQKRVTDLSRKIDT